MLRNPATKTLAEAAALDKYLELSDGLYGCATGCVYPDVQ